MRTSEHSVVFELVVALACWNSNPHNVIFLFKDADNRLQRLCLLPHNTHCQSSRGEREPAGIGVNALRALAD